MSNGDGKHMNLSEKGFIFIFYLHSSKTKKVDSLVRLNAI